MNKDGSPVLARLLHETHDLDSDDRKDAGHEVQDHSAQEHPAKDGEKFRETDGRTDGGAVFYLHEVALFTESEDSSQGVGRFGIGFLVPGNGPAYSVFPAGHHRIGLCIHHLFVIKKVNRPLRDRISGRKQEGDFTARLAGLDRQVAGEGSGQHGTGRGKGRDVGRISLRFCGNRKGDFAGRSWPQAWFQEAVVLVADLPAGRGTDCDLLSHPESRGRGHLEEVIDKRFITIGLYPASAADVGDRPRNPCHFKFRWELPVRLQRSPDKSGINEVGVPAGRMGKLNREMEGLAGRHASDLGEKLHPA